MTFELFLYLFSSFHLPNRFENQQSCNSEENWQASSQWKKQNRVGVLQSPIPKELSLFDLSWTSLENFTHRTYLFDLTQSSPDVRSFLGGCFSKIISSNYLTQQLLEATIIVKTNNKLTKRLNRKIWGLRHP